MHRNASPTAALEERVADAAVAPVKSGRTMADLIIRDQAQIAKALPKMMDPERYVRIVLTELRKTPRLMECMPATVMGAIMTAAQLGLELGPLGHAYLVPFYSKKSRGYECQLIIGYKGMISLARRSGDISYIVAREVRENDDFEYELGLEEKLVHKPAKESRGEVIAYYLVAKFRDGGHLIDVMYRGDVERRRARSQAKDDGPWTTDYDAMACKTLIRKNAPWLPLAVEVAELLDRDEAFVEQRGPDDFVIRHPELEMSFSDPIDVADAGRSEAAEEETAEGAGVDPSPEAPTPDAAGPDEATAQAFAALGDPQ